MPKATTLLTSTLTSTLRGWAGINSVPAAKKPEKLLELYDIENSPFCRLVREALTELDLDAIIYPCPKNGSRYRPEVVKRGGKALFPYLVDPNTGEEMYESLKIITYLYSTYGQRELPLKWRAGALQKLSSAFASAVGLLSASGAQPSKTPAKLLELYSFEASPYARPVRELLCRMEMPYILRSCGRTRLDEWLLPQLREKFGVVPESELKNRKALLGKEGKMSIPYLYDANTGTGLFESDEIMAYLQKEYGV